ncbi:MAG: response regulator transcription factor [Prevotella sp.]|uniref:response regulator transcription factor n=1 Tax=Prevotella sp. TaxID=59823 RepID=UPI002A2918D8|nr:response regulator transcription factor [Prevotella sp.]MDD7318203.1 response regulator transcription factor [Prevotellaceae bacterium]MDY4020908.1 response regulator transcription factor [Prevotella sp.]
MERPKFAIIDPNTLSVLGLKQILQNVMPIIDVLSFHSLAEFETSKPEQFAHIFVAMNIVLDNRSFFIEQVKRTIVLTTSQDTQISGFKSICINVPEKQLIRSILMMHSGGHPKGAHLPQLPESLNRQILTGRELEVMSLIVQGFINKEIADKLNIGLTTVITHRKNIMDKLGMKSVSALTIYAVMHGYVDISKI